MKFTRLFVVGLAFQAISLNGIADETDLLRQEIQHIVVVVLENRSFDNLFGWLYNEEESLHFIPSHSSLPFQGLTKKLAVSFANPLKNSAGETLFSCPPVEGVPSVKNSPWINSPGFNPHEPFPHVWKQVFGFEGNKHPTMLGFVQDYASHWHEKDWKENQLDICAIMESYTARELPVFHALARHYAISDQWFSSVPTQTNPNRAFLVCGTSEGETVNGWLAKNTFQSDTIWNRLSEESPDTSWAIFWQTDMVPGIFPGPYHGPETFAALRSIPNLDLHYSKIDEFHKLARKGELPHFSFIEPQWTFSVGIELDRWGEIFPELANSEALLGFQGNDLHPPGDVRTAENFLANIYTSLIANKEAWEKTLLVVLFDEHGGIFDHVAPPPSLPPDDHFQNGFSFDLFGVRTPALFISPRIKKGTVIRPEGSNYPFDHTSLIATLFKWKQIPPEKWGMGRRTAYAPTFESVITESVPRKDRILESPSNPTKSHPINMGDSIILKNPKGSYLSAGNGCFAAVGTAEEKVPVRMGPLGGRLMHGSFVCIELNHPEVPCECILDSACQCSNCYYKKNTHSPGQWWTLKSVDHPYLGYEIQEGDRIYLESHTYLDPLTFVPSRLAACDTCFFDFRVITKAITDPDADQCYWFVEKN